MGALSLVPANQLDLSEPDLSLLEIHAGERNRHRGRLLVDVLSEAFFS